MSDSKHGGPIEGPGKGGWVMSAMIIAAGTLLMAYPPSAVEHVGLPVDLTPHPNKPWSDFGEFYPYYLREHVDPVNRTLHVTGTLIIVMTMLAFPSTVAALLAAGTLGFGLYPWMQFLPNGVLEGVLVLSTFIMLARLLTGRWSVALWIPVCGYSFAWAGHFFFEQNQPATFLAPAFSLAGDFRMWYDVIRGYESLGFES